MKKLMMIAVAVLFSSMMVAQTPQKPAEKKDPAKKEQKMASTSTAKPAEKKHPMHHTATSTSKTATSKPAQQKEAAKPARN